MTAPDRPGEPSIPTRMIAGLGMLGLALLVAATILGFLRETWWVFDLAAALRVQYAVGFLLLVVLFGILRSRSLAAIALVGLAVNIALLVPLYLDRADEVADDAPRLRVMFLNAQIVGADPAELIGDLADGGPDLVFLAAATDAWASTLETAAIPYQVAFRRPPGVDVELLVLARTGLPVETSIEDFGAGGRDTAVQAVSFGDTPVQVLAMHPVSPVTPERAEMHASQLAAIASWARAQDDPVVIIGDLNATPWSTGFQRLLEEGELVNSQIGFGIQASWPAVLGPLGIPIDHALHSEELTTVERHLGPGYGSEHRSLHVTFALSQTD